MFPHPSFTALRPADIRDQITLSTNAARLRAPVFTIIDAMQQYPAAVQIEALAVAMVAMSQTINLPAHDLVERARRQIVDVTGTFSVEVDTIRDYAAGELVGTGGF